MLYSDEIIIDETHGDYCWRCGDWVQTQLVEDAGEFLCKPCEQKYAHCGQ